MAPRAISPWIIRLAPTASGKRLIAAATSDAATDHTTPRLPRACRHIVDVVLNSRIVPEGLISDTPTAAVTPAEPNRLQRAATTTVRTNVTMKTIATS